MCCSVTSAGPKDQARGTSQLADVIGILCGSVVDVGMALAADSTDITARIILTGGKATPLLPTEHATSTHDGLIDLVGLPLSLFLPQQKVLSMLHCRNATTQCAQIHVGQYMNHKEQLTC